ncbi:MAG: hypothetical protein LBG30_00625, partial [Odoribacteraceae bacterium]|nr:hypothetical protein [Odoribacteraceae bacterium]
EACRGDATRFPDNGEVCRGAATSNFDDWEVCRRAGIYLKLWSEVCFRATTRFRRGGRGGWRWATGAGGGG